MLYCENCKVSITGNHEKCPLCQGDIVGEASAECKFPIIKEEKHLIGLILKIIAIITISASAISILVNLMFGGLWSFYVVLGSISGWTVAWITLKMHGNIAKNTLWLTGIISVLSFMWDIFIGYKGWSLDYVFPIMCCFSLIEIFVVANVKRQKIEDYIAYLIINIIYGMITLVLLLANVVKLVYPSVVCVAITIISLITLIMFEGKALKAEIIRRMHL